MADAMASNPYRFDDPATPLSFAEKWSPLVIYQLVLYFSVCVLLLAHVPNQIWDPANRQLIYVMGAIGIWRYAWWLNHWVRALIYEHITFPKIRARAQAFWDSGWRPRRIHVMMTTFREERTTAEAVARSICAEIRDSGVAGTVWIGSSEPEDERILIEHFSVVGADLDLELRIVRQNQPGKRIAIALILRAMSREGLGPNDIVAFMDGETSYSTRARSIFVLRCSRLIRICMPSRRTKTWWLSGLAGCSHGCRCGLLSGGLQCSRTLFQGGF